MSPQDTQADEPDLDIARIYACIDQRLPPEIEGEAMTQAVNERPDNILLPEDFPAVGAAVAGVDGPAISFLARKLWKPGRTLRVRFLDNPHPTVRAKIEQYAHEWEQHANIRFVFGNDSDAEIRITCTAGQGSWSYLGTDALTIPRGRATMNYGWFEPDTADDEFSRTVLHEFGHALGAIHEHQHPTGTIPWNREAVYRYYRRTQGWSQAQVNTQVFGKYSTLITNSSAYDPASIMHYPIPPELTQNGFTVGWNQRLSDQDKQFIRKMYP